MTKTDTHKAAMIVAMEKSLGIVTSACKAVGIARQTHYEWMKIDEAYKSSIEAVADIAIDFGESHLHKLIKNGSPAATIFFLKTKGKKRGYVERQEIETTGDNMFNVQILDGDSKY